MPALGFSSRNARTCAARALLAPRRRAHLLRLRLCGLPVLSLLLNPERSSISGVLSPVILSAGRAGVRERKDLKMRKPWHRPCVS